MFVHKVNDLHPFAQIFWGIAGGNAVKITKYNILNDM
jgi:hypothetical protein